MREGDCAAMQTWFDYSLARRKMANASGRVISSDLTNYVDHYMRNDMQCYNGAGRIKSKGQPSTPLPR